MIRIRAGDVNTGSRNPVSAGGEANRKLPYLMIHFFLTSFIGVRVLAAASPGIL